jgi:hypothetical protein
MTGNDRCVVNYARSVALATLLAIATPAAGASQAGTWKYDVSRNDGHELMFIEDGRVTFILSCGRGFALQVKYPGAPKEEGKARISLSSGKSTMTIDGEFVPPLKVDVPLPRDYATEFRQTWLGYARNDPQVYGKRWLATRSRLYALLGSGEPLTITAGKNSYQLPPIDAANWRTPFERCGVSGDSW